MFEECPECKSSDIHSKTYDTGETLWFCENCKHTWPADEFNLDRKPLNTEDYE
ncbi:hypothetical protein M3582_02335 [Priestia megaterium]|uniref:hypothetical protein n=1 Tax=Priestia megaterium TaxID=1404 RepID=UPI00164350D0|nr:hypothetical protein [Priestia megaterium]MCM3016913.1 hypothetical protein [Priestia megaterium]